MANMGQPGFTFKASMNKINKITGQVLNCNKGTVMKRYQFSENAPKGTFCFN